MADKLTDKEIIKALEISSVALMYDEKVSLYKLALNLINRQQAENKELKTENLILSQKRFNIFERIEFTDKLKKQTKAEAVKECLGKIEQMDVSESDDYIMVKKYNFDNLVKEMVGEDK